MSKETIASLQKKLDLLETITETISYNLNISDILSKVVDLVSDTMKADSCLIYLAEDDSLILKASKIPHPKMINKVVMDIGEGITGWTAKYKENVVIEEKAYEDKRSIIIPGLPEDKWEAFVSMPVIYKKEIVGVINVQHKTVKKYTKEEIKLLETIASQIGGAISNAKLTEDLKEALETRKILAKAKGILMKQQKISEEKAHKIIQKRAMDSKKSVKEIAETIVFVFES